MHNFQANYDKILQVLNSINVEDPFLFQISKPKLSDKEFISINLTSEYMGTESESQLFRILPSTLSGKCVILGINYMLFTGLKVS